MLRHLDALMHAPLSVALYFKILICTSGKPALNASARHVIHDLAIHRTDLDLEVLFRYLDS